MDQPKRSYYNCSVDGCFNSTLNSELSFFKLPVVSERRMEWLRLINREDLIDSSTRYARVCEAHFRRNSIIRNSSRKLLKRNSIPELLLPFQNGFENKGVQAIIETADANLQCDYDFETKAEVPQIKYPIPYAQSWPNAERAIKHKKATLRSAQKKHAPIPPQRCWPCGQARAKAPDPTVPHLKYGIFPKKPSLARGQSKTITSKLTRQPSVENENAPKDRKKPTRNAQSTEPPLFVFRAIDKASTRQLSMSETMHVDVKPRRILPMSPIKRNNILPTARVRQGS